MAELDKTIIAIADMAKAVNVKTIKWQVNQSK